MKGKRKGKSKKGAEEGAEEVVEAEGPKRKGKAKVKEVDYNLLKRKGKGKKEEVIEEMIDEAIHTEGGVNALSEGSSKAVNNEGLIRISRSGRMIKPAKKM